MDEKTQLMIIMWALTAAAVLIMVVRLVMKKVRGQRMELGEYLTMAAIASFLLRTSVETVVMVWGTNKLTAKQRAMHFTAEEIYRRVTASKLLIVNRVFYTVYIWLQKGVVMTVLQRLLRGLQLDMAIKITWATLIITFIPCIIMCLVECHPIQKYWQLFPDPGSCARGHLQLIVFAILNMITDIILMVLPLKHLASIQRPWLAKLRLIGLFMVGLTLVAVSLIRLLGNLLAFHRSGESHNVANVELFFAAFVANAPTIYGLIKMKYRNGSTKTPYSNSGYVKQTNSRWTKSAEGTTASATMSSSAMGPKKQRHSSGMWAKNGQMESDEELIIELPERSTSVSKKNDIHVITTVNVQ